MPKIFLKGALCAHRYYGRYAARCYTTSRVNLSLSFLPANKSVEYRERWLTKAGKTLMWTKIMTKRDT